MYFFKKNVFIILRFLKRNPKSILKIKNYLFLLALIKKGRINELLKHINPTFFDNFPLIPETYSIFRKEELFLDIREIIQILTTLSESKKNLLVFNHNLGGGAAHYWDNSVKELIKAGFCVAEIRYDFFTGKYILFINKKNNIVGIKAKIFSQIKEILIKIKFETIIINELVSYPFNTLKEIQNFIKNIKSQKNKTEIKILIHDYFFVCPAHNLLNKKAIYCEIPDYEMCGNCLQNNKFARKEYRQIKLQEWRDEWRSVFNISNSIITFSNSSKNIINKAFPEVENKIKVIPHEVDFLNQTKKIESKKKETKIIIGILGRINIPKGFLIVKDMLKIIKSKNLNIEIVIIGETIRRIKNKNLIITGKYERKNLPDIIKNYNIDIIFMPSICPETFSYTTEEAIMMELPVAVFRIGAQNEKVSKYKRGIVIDEISASSALTQITRFFNNSNSYE